MGLEYVPLLRVQRELYGLPRGQERFQAYLAGELDGGTSPGLNLIFVKAQGMLINPPKTKTAKA